MKKYIFGKRNGIYIIDLQKTLKLFKEASAFMTDLAASGQEHPVRRHQAPGAGRHLEEANRCGMFYVNNRWLGGTLTNFTTVRKSIERLKEIEGILGAGRQGDVQEGAPAARPREARSCRRT